MYPYRIKRCHDKLSLNKCLDQLLFITNTTTCNDHVMRIVEKSNHDAYLRYFGIKFNVLPEQVTLSIDKRTELIYTIATFELKYKYIFARP